MITALLVLGLPLLLGMTWAGVNHSHRTTAMMMLIQGYIQDTYQDHLGFKKGMQHARRAARLTTRRGYDIPALTWAANRFTGLPSRHRDAFAAEALAALQILRLRYSRDTDERWLVAFAGPRRDGAPLHTYRAVLDEPKRWRGWVADIGGPHQALAAISAELDPDEARTLARTGNLDLDALAALAALRHPAPAHA